MNQTDTNWMTRHVRVPCFFADDGWERGGLTLRYKIVDNGLLYRYSVCNPKDQYCRKLGVETADSHPTATLEVRWLEDCSRFSIEMMILVDIVECNKEFITRNTLDTILAFVRRGLNQELAEVFKS